MRKKLVLLLSLALLAMCASAATIWVNGQKITGSTTLSIGGGTVTYDGTNKILTLENVSFTREGSGNEGIYNVDVSGLTIKFKGNNSIVIKNASAVVLGAATTIDVEYTNVAHLTELETWASGQNAIAVYGCGVTIKGQGYLELTSLYGAAIEGRENVSNCNVTFAIKYCKLISGNEDLYNLNKVTFNPSSKTSQVNPAFNRSTIIRFCGHTNSSKAHAKSVGSWGYGSNVSIKRPAMSTSFSSYLTSTSYYNKDIVITDETNLTNSTIFENLQFTKYTENGKTYAALAGPTVNYYYSNPTSINVPGFVTIGGSPCPVQVANWAFSNMTSVETIRYNYGVCHIANHSMEGMSNLSKVYFPSSLKKVETGSFHEAGNSSNNISAYWATLDPSLTTLETNAFESNSKRVLFYFPTEGAITKANQITAITKYGTVNSTPDPLTCSDATVGSNYYVIGLLTDDAGKMTLVGVSSSSTSVSVTSSNCSTTIGGKDYYCTSIAEKACYNKNITSVNLSYSGLKTIGASAFSQCSSLTTVTLNEGLTTIGESAFYNANQVRQLTIPSTVVSIGTGAFNNWSSLMSVTWNAESCADFTSATAPFYELPALVTFNFGSPVTKIPAYLCHGLTKISTITIPSNVSSIGKGAFTTCERVNTVNWYTDKIGDYASSSEAPFRGTTGNGITSIKTFNFGNGVTKIPAYICNNMKSMTSVTMPNSLTTIGNHAFYCCDKLESITIPAGVTTIGKNAFLGCVRLKTVNWNPVTFDNFNEENPSPFAPLDGLTRIKAFNFGSNVTKIPDYICSGLTALESINIPDKVNYIGEGAFYGCTAAAGDLVIPDGVTKIRMASFYFCPSLESITIPNTVTKIEDMAFYGCGKVESLDIPESVEYIGEAAFYDCGLRVLSIGKNAGRIKSKAFGGCGYLEDIYSHIVNVPDEETEQIDTDIFDGVDKENCNLHIPKGTLAAYKATRPWREFLNIKEEGDVLLGDCNGDGEINVQDVTALITYILGTTPEGFVVENANINQDPDGTIDVQDVTALINMILE